MKKTWKAAWVQAWEGRSTGSEAPQFCAPTCSATAELCGALEGTRYTTKEVGMLKVGAEVRIQETLFAPPISFSAHRPAMRPRPLALQLLLPLDTHLVAKPAKCTPSAPAAVAGAQKVCKLREATVRSPAHELQQASRGGLRSVRITPTKPY